MVDYCIINGTDAELTNVNVGGTDVPARTITAAVTLTDTELGDLIDAAGENSVALMNVSPTDAEKMDIAQTIIDAREAKKISRSEADRLLSELKEADGIWENPVKPDAKTAECLWEQ